MPVVFFRVETMVVPAVRRLVGQPVMSVHSAPAQPIRMGATVRLAETREERFVNPTDQDGVRPLGWPGCDECLSVDPIDQSGCGAAVDWPTRGERVNNPTQSGWE